MSSGKQLLIIVQYLRNINALVQERRNSVADALELRFLLH